MKSGFKSLFPKRP